LGSGVLTELISSDPNATLCCGWQWGPDGATGYIASDLLHYAVPGLTRMETATGSAKPLVKRKHFTPGEFRQWLVCQALYSF